MAGYIIWVGIVGAIFAGIGHTGVPGVNVPSRLEFPGGDRRGWYIKGKGKDRGCRRVIERNVVKGTIKEILKIDLIDTLNISEPDY